MFGNEGMEKASFHSSCFCDYEVMATLFPQIFIYFQMTALRRSSYEGRSTVYACHSHVACDSGICSASRIIELSK